MKKMFQDWHNLMLDMPENLPTKAVLTAEQARKKAEGYLKQYFPSKSVIPNLTFATNRLEYGAANYNYIRPADKSGYSNYVANKDETTLMWKNYFDRPVSAFSNPFPVIIYVDAVIGEMLGGSD